MDEWKVIEEFPNYSVSNTMKVRNNRTGRILRQQYGAVSLSDAKKHMKARRGVLNLVLKNFEGFPREEDSRCRTKIRVLETGEIFYGYKALCAALGIPYERNGSVSAAACRGNSVNGYHFEIVRGGM